MKIYCNDEQPELVDGHWINATFETPDKYTLIYTGIGALDVRVNPNGEVAVYIPNSHTYVRQSHDIIRLKEKN